MIINKWEILKIEISKQHSKIRTNPKSYIPILLRYLNHFNDNILYKPYENIGIETSEGKHAYLECIEFLKRQMPVGEVIYDHELSKAAQDHALDLGQFGLSTHIGTDNSTMDSRIEKYLEWDNCVVENIELGSETAEGILVSLIVDDGVYDRSHRSNIFNPALNYVGVGISRHKEFGVRTVIDYVGDIKYYKDNKEDFKSSRSKKRNKKKIDTSYSACESDLGYLTTSITKNKSFRNEKFADDDYEPDNYINCKLDVTIKKSGGFQRRRNHSYFYIESRTIKSFTLNDGTEEVIEIDEIYI